MTRSLTARRRLVALAEVLALVIAGMLYVPFVGVGLRYPGASDFGKYYASARFVWQGESIYTPVAVDALGPIPEGLVLKRTTLHPNLSPPPLTVYLAPLGLMDYRSACLLWTGLSFACGIAAAALVGLATAGHGSRAGRVFLLLTLVVAYFPTMANARLGQVALFLLLLLSVVWLAARQGRDALAGIALGLTLTIKPFAAVVGLFFLIRRRWRVVVWCAATCAAAGVASAAVLGVGTYREYLEVLSGVTWYAASWNASLLGFLTRIFGGSENTPLVDAPWLAHSLHLGLSLAGLLAMVWLAWPRRGERPAEVSDLGFGLSLVLMLLVSPLGWIYYFPVLLIALVVGWEAASQMRSRAYRWALAAGWVLSSVPSSLTPSSEFNQPLGWFTWPAAYTYTLVVLAAVLALLLIHVRRGDALQEGTRT